MNNRLEHVSNVVKHVADAGAGTSIILVWVASFTPLLEFIALGLALIYGWYRIIDMKLSNAIKKKELNSE